MRYYASIKVTPESMQHTGVTDEYFYRELAVSLVRDMEMRDLIDFINLKKTDPFSLECKKRLLRPTTHESEREIVTTLRNLGLILFEAECETDKDYK